MGRSREEREYEGVRSSRSDRRHDEARVSSSSGRVSSSSGRVGSSSGRVGGSSRGKFFDEDERPIKGMRRSIEEKEYGATSSRSHRYDDDPRSSRDSYSRGKRKV